MVIVKIMMDVTDTVLLSVGMEREIVKSNAMMEIEIMEMAAIPLAKENAETAKLILKQKNVMMVTERIMMDAANTASSNVETEKEIAARNAMMEIGTMEMAVMKIVKENVEMDKLILL